jgi:hypothetical protein
MTPEMIDDLLAGYREGAEGTSASDPKVANRWQRKMHACYKQLRESPEGRAAIVSCLDDPSPHVRCWAGAHCLQWELSNAKFTLERLRDSKGPCAFTAEITLEQHRKGKLSFDY